MGGGGLGDQDPPPLLGPPNFIKRGALDGDPQCRMSILRNGNVACPCRLFDPMSHVKIKNRLCHMSL